MNRGGTVFLSIRSVRFLARLAAFALILAASSRSGFAQEFYIGQLIPVAFGYCPAGTLPAEGQILAISSNTALFSLLGTAYGGNGSTTFGLPDLRGRAPIGVGQGLGLPNYTRGQGIGGTTAAVTPNLSKTTGSAAPPGREGVTVLTDASGQATNVSVVGPRLAILWCITTGGIFPSRP
jgi:microcystin-dependent protein